MDLVIKGGRVIDPSGDVDRVADVEVKRGKVTRIAKGIPPDGARIIDAKGCVVTPGLIDVHVHFREPGQEDKETIRTGSLAAARGGITSAVTLANTKPPVDNPGTLEHVLQRIEQTAKIRVYPVGCVSRGMEGQSLTEVSEMHDLGAIGFSDDGVFVKDSRLMRRALEYAGMLGFVVISHPEDQMLTRGGCMNEGAVATRLGLPGMPAAAEEIAVAREIALAKMTGVSVHLAHISTAGAVELIRHAKSKGVPVTAEAAPHHFSLTEERVGKYDTHAKMNPPLRKESDRKAIIKGLKDGTLDLIATDHAPHQALEKEVEFIDAPFGIVGLETSLPVSLTYLVEPGHLTLPQLIERMSTIPASVFGLEGGTLQKGAAADITIFDPKGETIFSRAETASRSYNSPYEDVPLKGKVLYTIVDGKIILDNGKLKG